MDREELIGAFELGDMGDVEFTELALDAGMSIEEIGAALERCSDDDGQPDESQEWRDFDPAC